MQTHLERQKMIAEIAKLRAETRKAMRETFYAPFLAGAAVMTAATALAGAIFAIAIHFVH